ncbi:hypothetical protein ACQKWADRAFT_305659 [Trichoderma austrokoningii]
MDLLCEPASPATPPRKTPYVCDELWDGGPFKTYPIRKGKVRLVPSHLRHFLGPGVFLEPYHELLYPTPMEEIQPFLQTWLWFGLFAEMLGLNETSDGVHLVENTVAAEGIRNLYANTVYISDDDGRQYISAKEVLNSTQIIAERQQLSPNRLERLLYIRDCLHYANSMIPSALNLDETVRYSICALGEYFSTGLFRVVTQSNPKIDVPNLAFSWHQNYLQAGGTIDKQMLQRGWCPSETEKIRSQFQGLHSMHHISQLQKSNANQGHSNCTRHLCTAFQMDIETYQPLHLSEDCTCPLINIDERATSLILRSTDTYPILRFDQIGDQLDDFELAVEPYEPGVPYVALSHVWANGLGNPRANSLPRCQVKRVAQLIASLQDQVEVEQTEYKTKYRIWIDTLCCPIELESKLIALERIAGVYRNAAHVLVLDATLTGLHSQDTHPAELLLRIYCASPWMRRLWTLQEGILPRSLYVQFADNAVRGYDLIVKLFVAGNEDPRYMRIWQDVMNAYNELQGFRFENGAMESTRPRLIALQRALQFRTVSVASDESLCISTLMSLDTKYIAATSDAETRMIRTWELLSKMYGGLPPRLIFYADEVLSTPGWRWAPRSLLGSSVSDPTMGFDERVLRLVYAPNVQGIPTPLGLKVAFPGCRLVPLPLAAGLSLHPWPGAINPSEDQIIICHEKSGKWYRIVDWYRSRKLSSWTDDEKSAFDRKQNDPLCREIDSGKCVLIYDEKSRVNDMLMACMALIENIPEDFEHSSIESRELNAGLRVCRTRTVIMSLLSDEEVRMVTVFRDLASTIAAYEETSKLAAIKDRGGEEWKSCMGKIKTKMREVVANALGSNPELVQTIKNTIGTDMEEYMWAYIPKIFSHTITMKETSSEQIWFVD